jgi:hypothetical protein
MSEKMCEGCGKALGVVEAMHWSVCFSCTRARAKAVANCGRCTCRKAERRERLIEVRRKEDGHSAGYRAWIACDRCLGTVRSVA